MDKKQLQQIIIILPIAVIAGIFVYFKYFSSPLKEKQKLLNADLEKIYKEYEYAIGRTARLPQLKEEIKVLDLEIAEMQKKLPPSKDVPGLIRMLSKKMESHNITWTSLTPGSQIAKDYYVEHSYSIPFTTTYHNLAKFLTEIGQMERIFATRFTGLTAQMDAKTGMVRVSGVINFLIYTAKS